ncbi:MAG: MFS transporter [Deltaproteobacteria bacterium]|nr:MAG: MFS transporter [Deltaproteobacteria bacterium]
MIQEWRQRLFRMLVRLAALMFQLREEEVPRVALMFLYSLMAVGTFILGRIVRDSLFLSLPDSQGGRNLPSLMALSAICVSAAAYIYSRSANKLRRDRMILVINLVLSFLQMVIYLCIVWMDPAHKPTLFKINYVYVEIMGSLQVILFWTLASELFDPRAAKRIFAIIGGGAVMANLLAFGMKPMVRLLNGTQHMLPVLSIMMLVCMAIVYTLGRESEQTLEQNLNQKQTSKRQNKQTIQLTSDSGKIWSNRHLSIIALVVVVTFLTTSIIDYQFKMITRGVYNQNPEGLSDYLSFFYGTAGIFACFVQFVLANRILQKSGIRRALLLLPVAFLLFTAPMLGATMATMLWLVTFAKGSENILRYTINDVSMNLLYVPVDSRMRARTKAFIDGIIKPGAIAVAAGLIILSEIFLGKGNMQYYGLSGTVLLLLGGWVFLIIRAHQEYVSTLLNSMEKSGLDLEQSQFSIQDESAVGALRQILRSDEPRQVLHALELLRHVQVRSRKWTGDLVPLLDSQHVEIRMAALEALSQHMARISQRRSEDAGPWTPSNDAEAMLEQKLFELIEAGHSDLRAKSIELLCILLQEEAISPLLEYLEDDSSEVRSATIVGLIRYGGLDGILHAATHLKDMLESGDPEQRSYGAQIIGSLGTRSFYQPLRRLMRDYELSVRLSAIEAAGKLCNLKLIPDLLDALNHRDSSQRAGYALARYGESVLPHLSPFLSENASLSIRLAALRVISLIGGEEAVRLIESLLKAPERRLRVRALKVLQRLVGHDPNLVLSEGLLLETLDSDFKEYFRLKGEVYVLETSLEEHSLLTEAMDERCETIMNTIFETLALLYPRRQIHLVAHHLQQKDARMRSYAIELLDNLLSAEIKRKLLPILEVDVRESGEMPAPVATSVPEILERLSEDKNPWVRSAVLWTVGNNELVEQREMVETSLEHDEPMVRETALIASKGLLASEEYRTLLQRFTRDPSPMVSRFVQAQLQALETG